VKVNLKSAWKEKRTSNVVADCIQKFSKIYRKIETSKRQRMVELETKMMNSKNEEKAHIM
jgi:hypothetical protein